MIKKIGGGILRGALIVFISFLIFLAIICGYLAGSMLEVARQSPRIDKKDMLANLKQNSQIVDPYGTLLETIETEEYREVIPYDKIPKNLINAFIAAEDKRFWEHNGVDLLGILSAIRDMASGDMRGASTLTMQLARNVYLSQDVKWTRKIQEIYLALKIEKELSKEEILEAYLNRVFFGQNAYGVEAAAKIYFSKNVWELDLAQCATIAGVVQAPSEYALYSTYRPSQVTNERVLGETTINGERYICVYNKLAYEREKYVLEAMLKNGSISQKEYDQAMAEDVAGTVNPPKKRVGNLSTYFTDLVKEQAIYILMDTQHITYDEALHKLYYGGLTITSTIDLGLQRKMQAQLANMNEVLNGDTTGATSPMNLNLDFDEDGNILGGGYLQYFKEANLMRDNKVFIPDGQYTIDKDGGLSVNSLRVDAYDGYLDLADYYTMDDKGILRTHRVGTVPIPDGQMEIGEGQKFRLKPEFFKTNKSFYSKVDGGIELSTEYYQYDEEGIMQPQAAVAVLWTETGEVRAIVGGREQESDRHFLNRASSFPRQPGSSFKPLAVYAGVIDHDYNLASTIDDTPVELLDGYVWPQNAYGSYFGLITVREALKWSSNPAAVKWLDRIGINASKEYLARFGIINREHPDRDNFVEAKEDAGHNDEHRAMALGALTTGMTPLDMASAYQTFGNDGKHIPAMAIVSIVDNEGTVYYKNNHTATRALSSDVNYQLLDALKSVANQDHTKSCQVPGIDTAGKTGTTDNKTDLWFCGTTPYYTMAVWMGCDNANLHLSGTSAIPAQLFGALSKIMHEGRPEKHFTKPAGIFTQEVCTMSGQKPTNACYADPRGTVIKEIFSEKTKPKTECKVHVWRQIDTRNGLLATNDTPIPVLATRVFIQRPDDYDPSKFNGVVPNDWGYNAPQLYSNLPNKIAPVTVTNPDGSKTTTSYNEKWDKIVVTVYKDGTKKTVITKRDGTVIEKTEKPPAPKPPQESSSEQSNP